MIHGRKIPLTYFWEISRIFVFFFCSDLRGALYLWMCVSLSLCQSELINTDFRAHYLSTWPSNSTEIWHTYYLQDINRDSTEIFSSDLRGALYLWMSVSMYLCLSVRIVQLSLQTSISQQLIIWLSWNLAYLSTLGCRLWYWCRNSCQ